MWGSLVRPMPDSFRNTGYAAELVGQTPLSARDALVPLPEQRYRHPEKREQADGGVGRSPGGLPHRQCRFSKGLLPDPVGIIIGPREHFIRSRRQCRNLHLDPMLVFIRGYRIEFGLVAQNVLRRDLALERAYRLIDGGIDGCRIPAGPDMQGVIAFVGWLRKKPRNLRIRVVQRIPYPPARRRGQLFQLVPIRILHPVGRRAHPVNRHQLLLRQLDHLVNRILARAVVPVPEHHDDAPGLVWLARNQLAVRARPLDRIEQRRPAARLHPVHLRRQLVRIPSGIHQELRRGGVRNQVTRIILIVRQQPPYHLLHGVFVILPVNRAVVAHVHQKTDYRGLPWVVAEELDFLYPALVQNPEVLLFQVVDKPPLIVGHRHRQDDFRNGRPDGRHSRLGLLLRRRLALLPLSRGARHRQQKPSGTDDRGSAQNGSPGVFRILPRSRPLPWSGGRLRACDAPVAYFTANTSIAKPASIEGKPSTGSREPAGGRAASKNCPRTFRTWSAMPDDSA